MTSSSPSVGPVDPIGADLLATLNSSNLAR